MFEGLFSRGDRSADATTQVKPESTRPSIGLALGGCKKTDRGGAGATGAGSVTGSGSMVTGSEKRPPDSKSSAPTASPTALPAGSATASSSATAAADPWVDLPMVAVWRKVGTPPPLPLPDQAVPGPPFQGPALRFALWKSGRVVFGADSASWDTPLREGKLDDDAVQAIAAALERSGVFDLRGTCYLVPDAPVLATLVRVGDREQILYWDEVVTAGFGINIQPKPQHVAFKKTWQEISDLMKARTPRVSTPLDLAFAPPPTWYVEDAIQSE